MAVTQNLGWSLQHSRLRAYQASSKARHKHNETKRKEPTSLKEVFSQSTAKLKP
ncbi:hypothetical protein [Psychrobacter submarinus]|uniref:hypothetical protein n=1 Tax=Psychrobacter submarinus TaxID=154108 RepID=UPI001919B3BE|nr:hypothetical protein [Psychrobacter submarinus]